jgi:hypothetical protein
MAQRFKTIDRNTPLLLALDLRDWVAEDDLVHFVIHAVQRLPLSAFALNYKGGGARGLKKAGGGLNSGDFGRRTPR